MMFNSPFSDRPMTSPSQKSVGHHSAVKSEVRYIIFLLLKKIIIHYRRVLVPRLLAFQVETAAVLLPPTSIAE